MLSISVKTDNRTFEYASGLACVFVLLLSLCLAFPQGAHADVRSSDFVKGTSVEQLGLTSSVCPNIQAQCAFVVTDSGEEFFNRNADEESKIASVTKIMTAIIAMENFDLSTEITVSQNAASIGESSAMLKAGDRLTLDNALRALMICSGNDAAQAIAESLGPQMKDKLQKAGVKDVPDNGYDAFIFAMNNRAKELGMDKTVFANPHGLDFDQYSGDFHSTARDVATMTKQAMSNDLFRSIVATDDASIPVQRDGETVQVALTSTDELLGTYNGACGVKTGYTNQAGGCFAGACERNGEILYAIILQSPSEAQRFKDCITLWDWVYDNTVDYPLVHSSQTTTFTQDGRQITAPVIANVSNTSWIDRTFKATVPDAGQTVRVFALDGNVSQEAAYEEVAGDVHVGQKVGTLTFKQHNNVIETVDLVAAEDCPGPNFFEGIGIFWTRIFSGGEDHAASTLVNTTPLIKDSVAPVRSGN